MKMEKNLWEQLSGRADLPDEVFPGQPLIEIVSNKRILIECHQGVQEYGTDQICVKVSYGTVQICGKNLHLKCMTKQNLIISGCIQSVALHGRNKV